MRDGKKLIGLLLINFAALGTGLLGIEIYAKFLGPKYIYMDGIMLINLMKNV